MAMNLVGRTYRRHEPSIGWLSFWLMLAALIVVISAALEVDWVPEDRVILPLALIGFVLALWLAQTRIPSWVAWAALAAAGIGLTIYFLADLWPPWDILRQGNPSVANYWEQAMALFGDRLGGWYRAAIGGGRTTETMGFAFGLALIAWVLGALLGWTSGRMDRPAWGLSILGIALAMVTYFGRAGVYWVVAFVGIATTTLAIAQYTSLERTWDRRGTDYSGEVRVEMLMYAGAVSFLLMAIAYSLPAINVRAIAESFRRQPAVSNAEDTLTRVFAGVQQTRQLEEVSAGATVGVLPRAFLLGGSPELLDTVVMTTTISVSSGAPNPPPGHHWRATNYDVYTGRGWLRSPEREENFDANEPFPQPSAYIDPDVPSATVTQDVQLSESFRTTRYVLGRLLSVDRPSVAYWRGEDDLVRVRDTAQSVASYQAQSMVLLPSPDDLRQASLDDVPAAIIARYTVLPDSIPVRVSELARYVTGQSVELDGALMTPLPATVTMATTPYDQALALEAFLRQYPYSLDVGLPPPGVDMVDYFLFDLQSGFCDYYASAMVVMARSLGLPARLAIGFLPQPSGDDGQQRLRQVDSHSWAEIYFAGYGWVEFEPTAQIPGQEAAMATVSPPYYDPGVTTSVPTLVDIPTRAPQREIPWPLALGVIVGALLVASLWLRHWLQTRRSRPEGMDSIESAYFNLQTQSARLGFPPSATLTPGEFVGNLAQQVQTLDPEDTVVSSVTPQLMELADMYNWRRYSRGRLAPLSAEQAARAAILWRTIRPQLAALSSPWRGLRRRSRT